MRLTKRWARGATACAAGALALGVGTVAAQSGEDPWWYEVFQTGPDLDQSTNGEVKIVENGEGGLNWMSGNLGRARQEFPETGEYIGCQIITDPNDGQFITCAARDAAGHELDCTILYEPTQFALRQHMMLTAAVNLTDSHYVAVGVKQNGECGVLQVMASSADFLAPREPLNECTEQNSVDLGAFGGSPVSVPNNACAKITKFAKPNWKYGPNRTLQLQNPTGNRYPVPFEYKQTCTGAQGSGQFDTNFDNQYLPGISDACTLFFKLEGAGNGTLSLRYW
jgi:hypothetical protein